MGNSHRWMCSICFTGIQCGTFFFPFFCTTDLFSPRTTYFSPWKVSFTAMGICIFADNSHACLLGMVGGLYLSTERYSLGVRTRTIDDKVAVILPVCSFNCWSEQSHRVSTKTTLTVGNNSKQQVNHKMNVTVIVGLSRSLYMNSNHVPDGVLAQWTWGHGPGAGLTHNKMSARHQDGVDSCLVTHSAP